ncbi:hypothetical protein [Geobacillus sp. C56-T2]|nr:hypothetical protein [Geobacillus sp. C56-T2]TWG31279.1 hypothetical protein GC56T2_2490 [Geobacillus sp. C56-T2]
MREKSRYKEENGKCLAVLYGLDGDKIDKFAFSYVEIRSTQRI